MLDTRPREAKPPAPVVFKRAPARSFRTVALSARIARTGAFAPPQHTPAASRTPSHATSGGA